MGRETYFPLQSLCHNAKVVHAFESITPFEKLPGTQINVPRLNLHSARAAPPVPHFPRFRALALFGRRSPQCVDSLVMPASENLHKSRHSRPLVLNKPGPESASAIRHCILSGQIACERTTKKHGHCAKLGTLLKPSPLWSTSRATTWPRGRPETLSIFRDSIGLPCPAGPARNGARPPESCRIVCLLRPAPPAPDLRCS